MPIRVRLLLSYVAMLLVPLFLLTIAVVVILAAVLGDLSKLYTFDSGHGNPVSAIVFEEADVAADIRQRIGGNPDSLLDAKVLQSYSDRLSGINMGLLVRREQDIVFLSPKLEGMDIVRHLPPYGAKREEDKLFKHKRWILDRHYDLTFTDGSRGSVFMLADVNVLGQFLGRFSKAFFLTLFIVLVLSNGILTYFVSRSITRPLRSLKKAAGQIKEGNLDHPVHPESRDEIGELAVAFEEMRQRLQQSVRLQLQYEENRKDLISNISHDLKTPVTAIKGYVEGIMDGVTDTPEKLERYIRTIYTKTVQMDRMIDELFLFSKLDLKRLPFHYETVDLNAFLGDCADELQMDVEKRGCVLAFEGLPAGHGPAAVTADRDKLKRVFVNVIENAVNYMDRETGGRIVLRLASEGGCWRAEVADNGPGIPADALPHVFDRFYRADPARNANTGGSGLGLAIARHIVEEHDGTIAAESRSGEGTVITVRLPKLGGKREGAAQ